MNQPDTPIVPLDKVEALRSSISDLFVVADTTLDKPHPGYVRFRGRFQQAPADCFDDLRQRFEQQNFTPMIREESDQRVALIGIPAVFDPPASNWIINLVLFILTILTTLSTGAFSETGTMAGALELWRGIPFSASIMLILGAHELGHYFAARYHKVPVTLPYFIPLPFISLIGTLGAFIRLKAPVKNKRALLDVGIAGPLAGMFFAVPILLIGLATSEVSVNTGPALLEGNSILYALSKIIIFGRMLPSGGEDVFLNQMAWAGWVGLLVTGLNLMPVGQLDGGHVSYVLFGSRAKRFFWPVIIGLSMLALSSYLQEQSANWVVWILLLFVFGRTHAEPLDDVTPLDPKRRWLAIATLILFVLVFVPVPFQIVN
ncbi:MAG: site-2 protease family protein [Anaerolineales bacterium]|nr:site-2 protease family protein [Anaerolineales bacterium]